MGKWVDMIGTGPLIMLLFGLFCVIDHFNVKASCATSWLTFLPFMLLHGQIAYEVREGGVRQGKVPIKEEMQETSKKSTLGKLW